MHDMHLSHARTLCALAVLLAAAAAHAGRPLATDDVGTPGARWWLVPERFGIDLVGSRAAGVPGTTWSFGFGWYGIGG